MKKTNINFNSIFISYEELNQLDPYEILTLATIRYYVLSKYKNKPYEDNPIKFLDYTAVISNNIITTLLNNNEPLQVKSKIKTKISNAFNSLLSKGLIIAMPLSKKEYQIKANSVLISTGIEFADITNKEFLTFFNNSNIKLKTSLVNLFVYYLKLITTINIHSKTGCTSIKKLSEKFNISEMTIVRYNKQLKDMNLISIKKCKCSNNSKFYHNVYCKINNSITFCSANN